MDISTLITLLIPVCGAGLFLRLVAKAKYGREQCLKYEVEKKPKPLAKAGLTSKEDE